MKKLSLLVILLVNCFCLFSQTNTQGGKWLDSQGKMINAHGGGILYYDNTYYWFGEFKGAGKIGHLAMDGVSCYSSKDLISWDNRGLVLKMDTDTSSMLQKGCILERPKVIYNAKTKKFVMWFHHELKDKGYSAALTGLAISDNPTGPYQYIKSIRPHQNVWPANFPDRQLNHDSVLLRKDVNWRTKVINGEILKRDFKVGQMSRDMTLFVDDDEKAYHITSSEDNQTLHISLLSEDYTSFTDTYYRVLPGGSNEAPAIFKFKKKYYLFTSGTTGWNPNPGRSYVSDNIFGPYESLGNPIKGSDEEMATTFGSQSTYILKVQNKDNSFIFMGDRWNGSDLIDSRYIWLPIVFEKKKPVLFWKPLDLN